MTRRCIPHPLRIERAARDACAWLGEPKEALWQPSPRVWAITLTVSFAAGWLIASQVPLP